MSPNEQIEVTTAWGYLLVADTKQICVPGLSLGARGLATLAAGLGHTPGVEEVVELTGEKPAAVRRYLAELSGTGYLDWEA